MTHIEVSLHLASVQSSVCSMDAANSLNMQQFMHAIITLVAN